MDVWYLQNQQSQKHGSELGRPRGQQSNTVEVDEDVCRRLELEDIAYSIRYQHQTANQPK